MTTNDVTAVCTVCQKHKNKLHTKMSSLKPDFKMYVCGTCLVGNKEPRWLIVLVGRRDGIEAVRTYLDNHAYTGPELLAKEL